MSAARVLSIRLPLVVSTIRCDALRAVCCAGEVLLLVVNSEILSPRASRDTAASSLSCLLAACRLRVERPAPHRCYQPCGMRPSPPSPAAALHQSLQCVECERQSACTVSDRRTVEPTSVSACSQQSEPVSAVSHT